jgi:hypothetical protein
LRPFEFKELRSFSDTVKVYGFKNIQNLMRKIKTGKCDYHYIEVMACPKGWSLHHSSHDRLCKDATTAAGN